MIERKISSFDKAKFQDLGDVDISIISDQKEKL